MFRPGTGWRMLTGAMRRPTSPTSPASWEVENASVAAVPSPWRPCASAATTAAAVPPAVPSPWRPRASAANVAERRCSEEEIHANIVAERMRLEQQQEQLQSHIARLQQEWAFWDAMAARAGDVPNPRNIECTFLPGGGFRLGPAPRAASLIAGEAASAAATAVPVKPPCPPPPWLKDQAAIAAWRQEVLQDQAAPAPPPPQYRSTCASSDCCQCEECRQHKLDEWMKIKGKRKGQGKGKSSVQYH